MTYAAAAVWLGILTAMGPCTMTTNVLALAYIAKRLERPSAVLWATLWFTVGTMLGYAALGGLVAAGALSMPAASHFLQKYMNELLGPVLILTGVVLFGLVRVRSTSKPFGPAKKLADRDDALGAFLLGWLFALTFCPVSAALFFGTLIPLALKQHSVALLPGLYGLGTGLPPIAAAILLAGGAQALSKALVRAATFEVWARRVTGAAFVVVGVHYCLAYVFELY